MSEGSEGFVVDLSSVPDLAAIPEGYYICAVAKAIPKTSKNGKPMITVTWEVTEGEFTRRKIPNDNWIFVGEALMFTKARIKNLGCPTDFQGSLMDLADLLVGKMARVKVTHEMWEGENRARAAQVLALGPTHGESEPSIF